MIGALAILTILNLRFILATTLQSVAESMRSTGFGIDSMHTFTDLRGGQEGTGDEQVLVVWTASGKSLEEIALRLGEVSEGLPYE